VAQRTTIDRASYEPAYAQLVRLITERIASGEFKAGDRLPSEAELCERYGVSPMTVRRAVTMLVQDGVAVTEQGRGTFVRSPELSAAVFDLEDLRRYLTSPEMQVRILEARVIPASDRVRERLSMTTDSPVIVIKRLLMTEGEEPVFYHSEYLEFDPARPLVETELGVTSLQGLFLGSGGSTLKYGRLTLHASTLTQTEAEYLLEKSGAVCWVIEHLFYDFDDRPQSWGRFVCRADRLSFSTTVGIATAQGALS